MSSNCGDFVSMRRALKPLKQWLQGQGGYIHPAIALSSSTTSDRRGMIVTKDIDEERILRGPLIKLPHTIRVTTNLAKQKLAPILQAAGLQDTDISAIMAGTDLAQFLPLGLFIAHERNKGKGSFWHPYLDMLLEQPGCAWLMQPEQLTNALAAAKKPLGARTGAWPAMIECYRHKARMQANAVAEVFGKELHVNSEDVMWGLGQVQVRCFGPPWGPYLIPGIDLCNHSPHAASAFTPQRARPGKEKMCVSSMWDDAPKALAAGDELCISYNYGWRHPDPQAALDQCYAAFLTRGFVPFEYLPARRSRKGRILAPAWPGVGTILVIMPTHATQEPVRSR